MQHNDGDDGGGGAGQIGGHSGLGQGVEYQYQAPIIAKLLHALPHYNITFHRTNSTFRPKNAVYLESLGILGSVPAALLIVSLFGLLLYLLTRCCDRKPRPAHSITSLKVTLSVVTVLCCGAIGLGLYGNDDLHNGLLEVLQAGRTVDNIVSGVRNHTTTLENTLSQKIRPQLVELADIFDQPASNQTALSQLLVALNYVQNNVTVATNAAGDIRRPLMGVKMGDFLSRGEQWELIRWPGTVAILALLLVLCAVLLVGVARHSRCALILFSVCGLLAVTGSWLMSGVYLSTAVAVGDLCIDPADYLVSEAPSELPNEVLLYYAQCEMARSNPFTQRLRESQNAISSARTAMLTVTRRSQALFKSAGLTPKLAAVGADLNNGERLLTQLTAQVDCKTVHYSYVTATRGLCEGGLLGLVLMLVASFVAAILLTVMVWVDSHTWIYIRKRHDYAQVDEPAYVLHQHQMQQHAAAQQAQMHQQQHQQQHHQHQQHSAAAAAAAQQQAANMARTLPRNHHQQNGSFNRPPVISGSHTLQHPRHKQNDLMAAHHHAQQQHALQQQQAHAAQQQQMRSLGTHTLGRLPSHNHSPGHHGGPNGHGGNNSNSKHGGGGPNNACSDTGQPPVANYAAHPNYKQHQQQQQQQPPQPIYSQHPKNLQHQQQQQQPHPIYQSQAQAQYQQQQLLQQQQQLQHPHPHPQGTTQRIYQQNPYGTTMRRPQPNSHQSSSLAKAPAGAHHPHPAAAGGAGSGGGGAPRSLPVDTPSIPSSANAIDGAMYERDKQIYRCSTMRPSTGAGRYENGKSTFGGGGGAGQGGAGGGGVGGMKPSILNCPLPAIPTEAQSNGVAGGGADAMGLATPTSAPTATVYDRKDKSHYSMSRTLGRPLKNPGKPILPPIIAESPRLPPANQQHNPAATSTITSTAATTAPTGSGCHLPPPPATVHQQHAIHSASKQDLPLPSPPSSPPPPPCSPPPTTAQLQQPLPPPPPPDVTVAAATEPAGQQANGLSPNDESNYAVTEL